MRVVSSDQSQLAFIDEEAQFACLVEIDLRGEQADGFEPGIAIARHGCRGDCEERAAEAIARGMEIS